MDALLIDTDEYLRRRLERICRRFPTLPRSYISDGFEKAGQNVLEIDTWLNTYTAEDTGLRIRIQALPSELQDLIFDFCIFSSTADDITHITDDTRPPLGLQINPSTRTKFALLYYGSGSIFEFSERRHRDWPWPRQNPRRCARWISSLPTQHAQMLQTLKIQHGDPLPTPRYRRINYSAHRKFMNICVTVSVRSGKIRDGVVYTDQFYWHPDDVDMDRTMWFNVRHLANGGNRVTWL